MSQSDDLQARLKEQAIETDRDDLMGLLELRFGDTPADVRAAIAQINTLETLERLILVAANVPNSETFLKELKTGDAAFRITGEDFNPLADSDPRSRPDNSGYADGSLN